MRDKCVVIIAHSHPAAMPGGGEIAAYQMFEEIRSRSGWTAIFFGRSRSRVGAEPYFSKNGKDDYFIKSNASDFDFEQFDRNFTNEAFVGMLRWAKPTVIHFHHYLFLGVDLIKVARHALPDARIVLTLHEYLAICANHGQMVTRGKDELCYGASPSACNRCVPERTEADFFLRKLRIQGFFANVDHFISPSSFLKDRYVQWGIPAERITVIENGQPPDKSLPPRPLAKGESTRGRFAFFGQLSRFKGIDHLLQAVSLIPEALRAPKGPISLAIAGGNIELQSTEFQQKVHALAERLEGVVHLRGRYRLEELRSMMARIDWVVIPSIWWENSPLVIQESKKFGRPMIVSGIGGMAEKVRNGFDGLHVEPGSAHSLAETMIEAATTPGLFDSCHSNLLPPATISETVDAALKLYEKPMMNGVPRSRFC